MNKLTLFKTVSTFVKRHSNVILTVAGVAGVIATGVSASKCAKKYEIHISDAEYNWSKHDTDEPLPAKDKVCAAVKSYWPTIIIGAATITCFVANGVISEKRIAGIGTAYNVAVKSFNEYKKYAENEKKNEKTKTNETTDNKTHEKEAPTITSETKIEKTEKGTVLFKEDITGRMFYSNPDEVKAAINAVNEEISQGTMCTLNDLFDALNLDSNSSLGDDLVWDVLNTGCISIVFESGVYMQKEPYILLSHRNMPIYYSKEFR